MLLKVGLGGRLVSYWFLVLWFSIINVQGQDVYGQKLFQPFISWGIFCHPTSFPASAISWFI